MKISKIIRITGLVLAVTVFAACSDWLGVQPEDGVTGDKYWKTKEEVRSAVFGCYAGMLEANAMIAYFVWGEGRADMVQPTSTANDNYLAFNNGEITPNNGICTWGSFYKVINQCNTVIARAPEVLAKDMSFSQTQLKEYIAEVTAIRSLMYFYLVRTFRDVPYVVEASLYDDQNYQVAKTDGATILENLVASLKEVANDIPYSYSTQAANKGRFNIFGLKALLADIYLWKEDYQSCVEECNVIINSGQYSLVPVSRTMFWEENPMTGTVDTFFVAQNPEDLFRTMYANGNSVESIFELQNPVEYVNPFYSMFGQTIAIYQSKKINLSSDFLPPSALNRAWRDIRGEGIAYVGDYIWKWVGLDNSVSPIVWRTNTTSNSNWIFYRLADVILMRAEAKTQLAYADDNQTLLAEALADITTIRERANATETTDLFYKHSGPLDAKTMEEFVLDERAREFLYEGKRWFDVLRTAKRFDYDDRHLGFLLRLAVLAAPPEKVTILQNKWSSAVGNYGSHYLPIHSSEVAPEGTNKNLLQNPFYLQ